MTVLKAVSLIGLLFLPNAAFADEPVIENVTATQRGSSWSFSVTLSHPDTGWDHYADGWEVLDQNGTRLGFRELLHPHVNEQPFTRSLGGVTLPETLDTVYIRARDNIDGWGTTTYKLTLPR